MRLNYYSCGGGFPVVILHGLFGSSDNWQTLAKKLKAHFKIFAVDLRNHGGSPHDNDVSYPALAHDLLEFLDEHRLPEIFLLGHSMGGKVAMQFASEFPEHVRKLIVADIAPKTYARHHDKIFAAMLGLDLSQFKSRGEVDRALAPQICETALRQFLLKNVSNDESGALRWKINLKGLYENYDTITAPPPLVKPFKKPALFLRGDQSDYILPDDEPLIRKHFPAAEIQSIRGTGHWLHAEKPQEFFEAVQEFLARETLVTSP
jgi:esterase